MAVTVIPCSLHNIAVATELIEIAKYFHPKTTRFHPIGRTRTKMKRKTGKNYAILGACVCKRERKWQMGKKNRAANRSQTMKCKKKRNKSNEWPGGERKGAHAIQTPMENSQNAKINKCRWTVRVSRKE